MTRRGRRLATLRGDPVDRPPVSFYELNGLAENPRDSDLFTIYSNASNRLYCPGRKPWLARAPLPRSAGDVTASGGEHQGASQEILANGPMANLI